MYAAFPHSQYYDRSAPPPSHQPQASPALPRPTAVVPRFRVVSSTSDVRLPLYTPTMRSASVTGLRGFHPCNQRHSVTKSTFPRLAPGTARLSPSLSVRGLARFRMRQARVSYVAIVRLRLAVSGQDRVCPYPHVPRASGCLCLLIHNLPGQPHLRGGVGGWSPLPFSLLLSRCCSSHHYTTQLPGALLSTQKGQLFSA